MKISEYFQLNKTQRQLDFVNIYIGKDIPLFIDPSMITPYDDEWSLQAELALKDFFSLLLKKIKENKTAEAMKMLSHLSEPKDTYLGLGRENNNGSGIGKHYSMQLFKSLSKSKAVKTGFLKDLKDCELLIEGIGFDRISDMTTNIIRKSLIEYTQKQCEVHDVPLEKDCPSGMWWCITEHRWKNNYTELPIINNQPILLIPKKIVVHNFGINSERFYQKEILEYLQSEHLSLNTGLVETLKSGKKRVTKKSLKEIPEYRYSKEFIFDFCNKHPEILEQYKRKNSNFPLSVSATSVDNYYSEILPKDIAKNMLKELSSMPSGTKYAKSFHDFCIAFFQFCLYPDINAPHNEHPLHDKRKRVDILFYNNSTSGFFYDMKTNSDVNATTIIIECKNYTADPANSEIDQLSGRFSRERGKFGFLVTRKVKNKDKLLNRYRDTVKDGRGYILPLDDSDIKRMLNEIIKNDKVTFHDFLNEVFLKLIS